MNDVQYCNANEFQRKVSQISFLTKCRQIFGEISSSFIVLDLAKFCEIAATESAITSCQETPYQKQLFFLKTAAGKKSVGYKTQPLPRDPPSNFVCPSFQQLW